jgi:hypothetical protein
MMDPVAERRAKLIDLIMTRRRSELRGNGVEGVELDRAAVEADVLMLHDITVGELISRLERLPGAVIW